MDLISYALSKPLQVSIGENDTLNKTWQQINDAMTAKGAVIVDTDYTALVLGTFETEDHKYAVAVNGYTDPFISETKDGYPSAGDNAK